MTTGPGNHAQASGRGNAPPSTSCRVGALHRPTDHRGGTSRAPSSEGSLHVHERLDSVGPAGEPCRPRVRLGSWSRSRRTGKREAGAAPPPAGRRVQHHRAPHGEGPGRADARDFGSVGTRRTGSRQSPHVSRPCGRPARKPGRRSPTRPPSLRRAYSASWESTPSRDPTEAARVRPGGSTRPVGPGSRGLHEMRPGPPDDRRPGPVLPSEAGGGLPRGDVGPIMTRVR